MDIKEKIEEEKEIDNCKVKAGEAHKNCYCDCWGCGWGMHCGAMYCQV